MDSVVKKTKGQAFVESIKKDLFLFGLIFAQISNFFFWLEEAIPFEEFFIFDMFLVFSLFFVIHQEISKHKFNHIVAHYVVLLGALNNFIATSFFFLWGLLFPEKDIAFVEKIGINGNFQTAFDIISLIALHIIFKRYKEKLGLTSRQVVIAEIALVLGLLSSNFLL